MDDNQVHSENTEEAVKDKKNSPMVAVVSLVALAVLAVGYIFARNNTTPVDTAMDSQMIETETEVEEMDGFEDESDTSETEGIDEDVELIEVEGGSFYFDPNEIVVVKGEKVKLTFLNAGGTHDFVIDDLNVRTPVIQTGEEAEVEFTAPTEPGSYEFYCSVGNHKALGMKGTLVVE